MRSDVITGWLSEFSTRHNLPHITPHAFRHTVASVLLANGTDLVTVSKQLGHASVNTTESFYSHIIEENKAKASACIADVLLRKKGIKNTARNPDGVTQENRFLTQVTQNGELRHFKQCQKVRKIPAFISNTGYFYGCGGLLHLVCATWTNRVA